MNVQKIGIDETLIASLRSRPPLKTQIACLAATIRLMLAELDAAIGPKSGSR